MKQRAYIHRGGDTPLLGETIDECFRRMVAAHGEHEAVVSVHQGRRLTYTQLDGEVEAAARGLLALEVAAGERVGIWATNSVEWLVLQMATARIGAVLVNINPAYRAAELGEALGRAEVNCLVLQPRFRSSDYVALLREAVPAVAGGTPDGFRCDRFPHLRRLVCFDPDDPAAPPPEGAPALLPWAAMVERGAAISDGAVAERAADLGPDDPINIQFTSGTTGTPKAVVLTHHNILNNGFFVGELLELTAADRVAVPVPFYHCFGMVVSNLAALSNGAALVLPAPHFDAAATLTAVADEACTVLHGVPTMFVAILEAQAQQQRACPDLRTGIMAGAPCPPEVLRRVIEELGCRDILVGYGQTEASPVTHGTRPGDSVAQRLETVGTNLPHQEVKVVDPADGRTVAVGEPGEVCFRGYHVMRGYYGQPEATARTIDAHGWLHSGDVGVLDADGYLRITGRLKDMIIRGGENIYPAEIEHFFHEHPAVADIAVFGVSDPAMGEEVAAFIRPVAGSGLTPEALRAWAKGRIAHFKIPRHCWLVEEFPMTVTGKIQKFRMREQAEAWLHAGPRPE
ncbi:MAG: AMP-binding protein [Planctomycetota bacterium]|jgi:fatty-acyl-CoA synthase